MKRLFPVAALAMALSLPACTFTREVPGSPAVLNADGTVKTAAIAPSEIKVVEDPLSALSDWVHQDGAPKVKAALAAVSVNAKANGDSTAAQCWDGAQPVVDAVDQVLAGVKQGIDGMPKESVIGWALWAIQEKRNIKGQAAASVAGVRQISVQLHNACDALANDEIKGKFDLFGFFSGQAKLSAIAGK